ncbi:SusC/RagA family TonB-linked outer membrane protein [Aureibacter tunicatorum]|uniref:TonB-linked SusC/RagA family outer membrane protein n=1 Tax=Aureibacter tunicatorum TaxID=866807 RepID=A0AAE3XQT6_9BACT|nr:TonB-dependent receptor [Aureibacter tunicatorum]MDR6240907.1 TonB-linked SusC/RagA family outer membrane protein [Aureibacter tunicatorum]
MRFFLQIIWVVTVFAIAFTSHASAQSRVITGQVIDANSNEPLPGVNVILKGTTVGTVTDIEGNYSLSLDVAEGTLVFSFIGLTTQEVKFVNETVIDVSLESQSQQLDEIVVTGYSEKSKEKLISTVAVVGADALENKPQVAVTDMLQGRAAGVLSTTGSGQPGAQPDIVIRGAGSISGNNSPLYVIDGIIVSNDNISSLTDTKQSPLASLNPNDIASVSILKDASATALYGARGANGVVVITTKTGAAGKTKFNFTARVGNTRRNKNRFEMMNNRQLWEYERKVYEVNGYNPDDFRPPSYLTDHANTDWLDLAYRLGQQQSYELSANGGSENTRFFTSLGFFDQQGILIGSDFERYTARLNLNHDVNKIFSFDFNNSLTLIDQREASNGNGFTSPLLGGWLNRPFDPAFTDGEPTNPGPDWQSLSNSNFVREIGLTYYKNRSIRTLTNLNMKANILKNLSFRSNNALDYYLLRQKAFWGPESYDGRRTNGYIYEADNYNITITSSNLFTYAFNANEKHFFDVIAGMEVQHNSMEAISAEGAGFASQSLETLNSAAKPLGVGGTISRYFFLSFLSQVNYEYLDKYFVSGSFRYDGSSKFSEDKRYAPFWSIGASWLMSNEPFLKDIEFIDNLKIRASYGTAGNANIENYKALGLWSGEANYLSIPGLVPFQLAIEDLTWEKNRNFNVGFDIGVWYRFTLNFDYYIKTSEAMLLERPIPSTTGFVNFLTNAGSVRNTGIEINLSGNILQGDFSWTTDFNFGYNKNKVLELPNGEGFESPTTSLQRIEEGEDVRAFFMRKWAGVDPENGEPLWYLEDGTTTNDYNAAPRMFVGAASPKFIGGWNNTLNYKGVGLNFFFNYTFGNDVYNQTASFYDASGARLGAVNQVTDAVNFWTPETPDAPRPKPFVGNSGNPNSYRTSSRYLEKGWFIRLRNVNLSYSLPSQWIDPIGVTSVRVYVEGANLVTFTDYNGIDPEVDATGTEFFRYPVGKSYSIGVNVQF